MAIKREVWQTANGSFFETEAQALAAEHEAAMERALTGEIASYFEDQTFGVYDYEVARTIAEILMVKFTFELKK
jgi:hypothetical protein